MDKNFYLNNDILDWMTNDKYQTIRFKDRIEYKENNQLSRIDGPAVEYFSDENTNLYYFKGKKISLDEFKLINKTEKIKQI